MPLDLTAGPGRFGKATTRKSGDLPSQASHDAVGAPGYQSNSTRAGCPEMEATMARLANAATTYLSRFYSPRLRGGIDGQNR